MLGSCDVIAFAAAADLSRARTFYEQTLGLPLVSQDDFAYVFNANGTMLRVTAVPHVSAGYTVLGWRVRDIEEAVRGLAARGVVFQRHDGVDQDETRYLDCPGRRQDRVVRRSRRRRPFAHPVPVAALRCLRCHRSVSGLVT